MPRPGKQTTERAKDFKGTLRQLLSALSQYKLSLIVVMVFAILSTIFNIAGPKILAKATTALATGWIAKLRGSAASTLLHRQDPAHPAGHVPLLRRIQLHSGLADDRPFPEGLL